MSWKSSGVQQPTKGIMKLIQLVFLCSAAAAAADIRLGIIGTDTSHVVVFTEMFNNPASRGHVAGARVVAAYKGGSPDIDSSWSRVDKYACSLVCRSSLRRQQTTERRACGPRQTYS